MKLAIGLLAISAFAQDAATTLEQARDRVLAASARLSKYVCVETIDRSYYSRKRPPAPCEEIALAHKRGQEHLQLDKTDRLRVAVAIQHGREIYSWTGVAPYAHGVEDVLNGGPIGTGPFAAYLLQVFTDPSVRFRLLSEPSETVEYGFRVPLGGELNVVWGGGRWLPSGFSGSLVLDTHSLGVRRLTVDTDDLPVESGICQETAELDFRESYLPVESRARLYMRDGEVSQRVTTISDCHDAPAAAPAPAPTGAPVPKGMRVLLRFDGDLDTDTAAAGDRISATVALPVIAYGCVIDGGAKVTGRIVQMAHAGSHFLITVAFDTLEQNGTVSPFYARLISPPSLVMDYLEGHKLTGHGVQDWPYGGFAFKASGGRHRYVVPAGFQSTWETVAPR
ncbi:MAG TPA: hypothetical protein VHW09_05320 [Bryobacteraceae bacterium]|jgi:hypothetical protein|nr:hypothetical protein [Bryobacteraceae bacterium]